MREDDLQRQNERREIFLKTLKIMVVSPEQEVTVLDEPWRVRIEISSPRKSAIILEPSRQLMTDKNIDFQKTFEIGITEAYKILLSPPSEKILQGKFYNDYKKKCFELYRGPE